MVLSIDDKQGHCLPRPDQGVGFSQLAQVLEGAVREVLDQRSWGRAIPIILCV